MAQNSCNTCNQAFNSERELQEHQSSSHSGDIPKQKEPVGDQSGQGDESRKIAS